MQPSVAKRQRLHDEAAEPAEQQAVEAVVQLVQASLEHHELLLLRLVCKAWRGVVDTHLDQVGLQLVCKAWRGVVD